MTAGPQGAAFPRLEPAEIRGLRTLIDRLGPGGRAGGSARIAELATRGVLQSPKFGARMLAPATARGLAPPGEPGRASGLHLDDDDQASARVVVIATGVRWRRLPAADADRSPA